MPAKKKTTPVTNLDDLLDGGPAAPSVDDTEGEQETEEHNNASAGILTPEQLELEALRAELADLKSNQAEASRAKHVERLVPESELTPEQRQIRQLQDELARTRGKDIENVAEIYEENTDGGILVHFLEDGLTSNGRNFYRGEEIAFGPEAYKETQDRYGYSWLNMSDTEQFERWGAIKFRKGPWPGLRKYEEPELANVSNSGVAPIVRL